MTDTTAMIQQAQNIPMAAGETASSSVAAQSIAMVQARYVMALQRPRNIDEVRLKLMAECKRPYFAAAAIYHKPIGKGVEGPSIRFAETAARLMGNILTQTTAIYDDHEKRILKVMCGDLETNTTYDKEVTISKTVERRSADGKDVLRTRVGASGQTLYIIAASDDDILNKENALVSKAMRTLLLRLIPGDLIDEAMFWARKTRADEDAKDPQAARRALFEAMAAVGVKPTDVAQYLGHSTELLSPEEIGQLRGIYTALRDGETTWAEVMGAPKEGEPVEAKSDQSKTRELHEKRKQEKAAKGAKPKPEGGEFDHMPDPPKSLTEEREPGDD